MGLNYRLLAVPMVTMTRRVSISVLAVKTAKGDSEDGRTTGEPKHQPPTAGLLGFKSEINQDDGRPPEVEPRGSAWTLSQNSTSVGTTQGPFHISRTPKTHGELVSCSNVSQLDSFLVKSHSLIRRDIFSKLLGL